MCLLPRLNKSSFKRYSFPWFYPGLNLPGLDLQRIPPTVYKYIWPNRVNVNANTRNTLGEFSFLKDVEQILYLIFSWVISNAEEKPRSLRTRDWNGVPLPLVFFSLMLPGIKFESASRSRRKNPAKIWALPVFFPLPRTLYTKAKLKISPENISAHFYNLNFK